MGKAVRERVEAEREGSDDRGPELGVTNQSLLDVAAVSSDSESVESLGAPDQESNEFPFGVDGTAKNSRRRRPFCMLVKVCSAAFLCGALAFTGLNLYVTTSTNDSVVTVATVPASARPDCILILGASVRANRKPSPMLLKRLEKGLELYKAGVAPKILVSGDNSTVTYNEVKVMREWLEANGVPSPDIFEDHAGFSTYESMYRARDVFKVKKAVVVSQRYHLARAIYTGEALGMEVWGVSAEGNHYRGQAKRDVREWIARVKDVGQAAFEAKPTYLGPEIPISGDGTVTH